MRDTRLPMGSPEREARLAAKDYRIRIDPGWKPHLEKFCKDLWLVNTYGVPHIAVLVDSILSEIIPCPEEFRNQQPKLMSYNDMYDIEAIRAKLHKRYKELLAARSPKS